MRNLQRVCVFCGSARGEGEVFTMAAHRLGTALAGRGVGLVYGGSSLGLMREVADAALDGGGEVIGVVPRHLTDRDVPYERATEMRLTDTMHERKAEMFQLSQAFIAMPGGLGTLDELMEISTWAQLGLHDKPIGLLNVDGYFDHLLSWLDHAVDRGFVRHENRANLTVADDVDVLLNTLHDRVTIGQAG